MQNKKSRRDEQRGMVDKGSRRNQIYAKKHGLDVAFWRNSKRRDLSRKRKMFLLDLSEFKD